MSKPYTEYKDSGIAWLGEVPKHWDLIKLKYAVTLTKEDAEERHEDFQIALENIESWTGQFIETDSEYSGSGDAFEEGDVLFNKLRPYLAKVFHAQRAGTPVGELLVLRPESDVSSRFMFYRLLSAEFIDVVDGSTYGAKMPRASWDFIGGLEIPMPPLDEQRTIAAYLDRKTAQVDTLIAKKQRLIDRLQEQRTAVINRAVTRGLDPDAPMQDSGIEWLSEVPAHWSLPKLKWITTKIGSGSTPKGGSKVYQNEGVIFLRSQNVQFDGLDLEDVAHISEEIHADMERSAVEPGDVLLNITGASIGRCTYVPRDFGPANVNQHVCIVRPMKVIMSEYLQMVLASKVGQYQVFSLQDGSSREGLNYAQLGSFAIPLPEIGEQKAIVRAVRKETDKIDEVVGREKKEINLLQELRTSLISEVVTGKIDVRDEVPEQEKVAA